MKFGFWRAGEPAADEKEQLPEPGFVAADGTRCVQCGVCGYNCPVGIDVRSFARRGADVSDPRCIACSNCINVCPRGTLRWETLLAENGA